MDALEDEGGIAEVEVAIIEQNAIIPNAIIPNAIIPNAIIPNAIIPNALTAAAFDPASSAAIQDPGDAGELSRTFVRYAVSCAFDSTQSFSFSWTDLLGVVHGETYVGEVGLAPEWATGPLDASGQRWVSACLAARTNFYGITVTISMRGSHSAIKQSGILEKVTYPVQEGAFWGNLFAPTPWVHACEVTSNADHARLLLRDCAVGHVGASGIEGCGMIDRRGACSVLCEPLDSTNLFHAKCAYDVSVTPSLKLTEVVTVFLQ